MLDLHQLASMSFARRARAIRVPSFQEIPGMSNTKVSFIVCTYSKELFPDALECINSLTKQDHMNKEILLVMDRNDELHKMFQNSIPASVNLLINENPGLSEARNLGIKNAKGDIMVFIDDDAIADRNYLSNLIKNYEEPKVAGVIGKILPKVKPGYPEELYWIGGFTYKGFPEVRCEVRNGHGCNMSFRKDVFDRAGLFDVKLGRVGKKLVTAEETEFSIRVLNSFPGSKIFYDPEVVVYHKVHEYRERIGYMMKRGYFEGRSKAHIEGMYKGQKWGNKAQAVSSLLFALQCAA
jgi:glycosyltransferase involved in cell wall biosynthesis